MIGETNSFVREKLNNLIITYENHMQLLDYEMTPPYSNKSYYNLGLCMANQANLVKTSINNWLREHNILIKVSDIRLSSQKIKMQVYVEFSKLELASKFTNLFPQNIKNVEYEIHDTDEAVTRYDEYDEYDEY